MTNNLVLACQPFSSLGKERVHAPPSRSALFKDLACFNLFTSISCCPVFRNMSAFCLFYWTINLIPYKV